MSMAYRIRTSASAFRNSGDCIALQAQVSLEEAKKRSTVQDNQERAKKAGIV